MATGLPASMLMRGAATAGIDRRLAIGAVLFGLGWGLSGYCPGPAITLLAALPGSGREADPTAFDAGRTVAVAIAGVRVASANGAARHAECRTGDAVARPCLIAGSTSSRRCVASFKCMRGWLRCLRRGFHDHGTKV